MHVAGPASEVANSACSLIIIDRPRPELHQHPRMFPGKLVTKGQLFASQERLPPIRGWGVGEMVAFCIVQVIRL